MTKTSTEYGREYRERNKDNEEYKEKRRTMNRDWIKNNRERYNASKYIYREKLKLEVLTHYSDLYEPCCHHCAEMDIDVLVLDHINDDGAEERRNAKGTRSGGCNHYERYRKEGYPEGLQVLCANCNLKKEQERKRRNRMENQFYKERKEVKDAE